MLPSEIPMETADKVCDNSEKSCPYADKEDDHTNPSMTGMFGENMQQETNFDKEEAEKESKKESLKIITKIALQLFMKIGISIFLSEYIIMLVLPHIKIAEIFIPLMDAAMLLLMVFPITYFYAFLPITRENNRRRLAESRLIKINKNLKYYVDKRTSHLLNEIASRKKAEEKIRHMAYYDVLTNLPNRTMMHDFIHREMKRSSRNNESFALLFIDLDNFKTINDTLGHNIGDLLLKEVGERLKKCTRAYDMVGRLGGDEFTILYTQIRGHEDIVRLSNRVLTTLKEPILLNKHKLYITSSIGISIYPQDAESVKDLFKNADTAMYKAKDVGRNNFQFYNKAMNEMIAEYLKLENMMCEALEREEFRLYYQPQIDIKSGKIIGVEALIRWFNLEEGMIPPLKFIPIAEKTGMILAIGEWVLKTACEQIKEWQNAGYIPIRMSVNFSARQFHHESLTENIKKVISGVGLDYDMLEIEITESDIMKDTANAIETLRKLKKLGMNISLDDFGTGYSSLNYLKNLPIGSVKIDRVFISNLVENRQDRAIVKAIIIMARTLNLKVIAEGVETTDQLKILNELDCDIAQGFLYSEALPPTEIEKILSGKKYLPTYHMI